MSMQRPTWLPAYIPELQGLRGLAVLGVVVYHCHPRLVGTWLYSASLWGWAGVNLFFVLSGFLITSILLEARDRPHYFRNFYARRALRIWPVYVLVLAVCYANAPWFIGPGVWDAVKTAPWWAYALFLQNLLHWTMPPAVAQTWSLAIEEQYYFLWAPVVRFLRRPWMLAVLLVTAFVESAWMRRAHPHWLTPTHSLIHLDGIALGSLLALGLYTVRMSQRAWLGVGLASFIVGIAAAATIAGGTAFPRFGVGDWLWWRDACRDCFHGGAQSLKFSIAARPAGILRTHQLRTVHDPHHGLHLFRLVRPEDGSLWTRRKPGDRDIPTRDGDCTCHGSLVRLRVADSEIEAAFLRPNLLSRIQ